MAQGFGDIYTERLMLRCINESDAETIVKWRSEPDVYKYFKNPHKITVEEHLNWYRNSYLSNPNRFDWMCFDKNTQNPIGVFGLVLENQVAEINYILSPIEQHKGYAKEAVKGVINYAVENFKVKHFIAEIHRDNEASIKFARNMSFVLDRETEEFVIYKLEV